MGEKPMGWAEDAVDEGGGLQAGGAEVSIGGQSHEDDDPMAAAGSINTTRSNIKNSAGVAPTSGTPGAAEGGTDDPPAAAGEPIPGIDVR